MGVVPWWQLMQKLMKEIKGRKPPELNSTDIVLYAWRVETPAPVAQALDSTDVGALFGPNGTAGLAQYLPAAVDLSREEYEPPAWRLMLAPPLHGVVFTSCHADGSGLKYSAHGVLVAPDSAYNKVLFAGPEDLKIKNYAQQAPYYYRGLSQQLRDELRITETGASQQTADKTSWSRELHSPDELAKFGVTFHELLLLLKSALVQRAGTLHGFLKCNSDSTATDAPLVGAVCDSFALGDQPHHAAENVDLLERAHQKERERILHGRSAENPLQLPWPLILAGLAYRTDAPVHQHPRLPIHGMHLRAACQLIKAYFKVDRAACQKLGLNPDTLRVCAAEAQQPCSRCQQRCFNVLIIAGPEPYCPACALSSQAALQKPVRGVVVTAIDPAEALFQERLAAA
jgi:hypothetical protein